MSRINVYRSTDDGYGQNTSELAGWFESKSAERFDQGTHWDGRNSIGIISGSQWIDEYLYRTKGGRWVHNVDATRYKGGPDTYEFFSNDEAHDWLIRSEINDEAVERFFGEIPEEEDRRGGRPEIGARITTAIGDDLLAKVDAYAKAREMTRAETIRSLLEDALDYHAQRAAE